MAQKRASSAYRLNAIWSFSRSGLILMTGRGEASANCASANYGRFVNPIIRDTVEDHPSPVLSTL